MSTARRLGVGRRHRLVPGGRFGPAAVAGLVLAVSVLTATPATAQGSRPSGRFSLFASWSQESFDGLSSSGLSDLVASIALRPKSSDGGLLEYALDARFATYPSSDRDQRVSLYEAYVGVHSRSGRWTLRVGNMWVQEVGGLGSVGGLFGEYRFARRSPIGAFRLGLFGGLEPDYWQAGYANDIRKVGMYAAIDGDHGRRHVLGYVRVQNSGAVERSVVVVNNFVPFGRQLSLYQALEYDTQGPAGLGGAELAYFLANVRYCPSRVVDLLVTYHRGRSIDARSITEDQLNGRPVAAASLEGYLFESARLRVTVHPLRKLSVWASYGQDRGNRADASTDRVQLGFLATDLFGSGVDLSVADSRNDRQNGSNDDLYASLGVAIGQRLYLSLDYNDSLAIFRVDGGEGGTIEYRPNSRRWALSSNLNLSRVLSFLLTVELLQQDGFDERRALIGLVVRF